MRDVSVEEPTAAPGATVTAEFVAGVFDGKLVVIGELLPSVDLTKGKDDDMLPTFHVDHSRVAVGFTGVVDEPCCVAMHGCIHHIKVINSEHITANALQGYIGEPVKHCFILFTRPADLLESSRLKNQKLDSPCCRSTFPFCQ